MRNYSKGDFIRARTTDGRIFEGIYERTSKDSRGNMGIMIWAYWNGRDYLQWMSASKIIDTVDYKVDQTPMEDEECL